MSKSPDAFRTISEVAEWLGIPAHVLRFWESKFTQIKPVKRAGGRRYYRPADMMLLGGIKYLLHENGQTIKQVQALLRDQGVAHVAEMSASLDETSDPMPVIEIEDTVVAFTKPRPPSSERTHMDLGSQQGSENSLFAGESQPRSEPEVERLTAEEDNSPVATQTPAQQTEFNGTTKPPAVANTARPQVIEVEDTADDALDVAREGILAQLAKITSLTESSQAEAAICADQLRALTTSQNNLAANS